MTSTPEKARSLAGTEIEVHKENLLAPLSAAAGTTITLPYFHSCSGKAFRSILSSGKIERRMCDVFDEELVYFFYGKPAYRMQNRGTNTRDASRFPVCFVISDLEDSSIRRVFPFDTGAMACGVYECVCGDEKNPLSFEIGSDRRAISLLVGFMYSSDPNYFYARPEKAMMDIDSLSFELQQIYAIIVQFGESTWDARAHSIEIQHDQDIDLVHAPIEAIILPDSFLNNPGVADFIYNNNITAVDYSIHQSNPSSATDILFEAAKRYLSDKGLL